MRRLLVGCAVVATASFGYPVAAQRAPMSWEMLDRGRPIYLMPWALVCRTIQQAEAAGLRDDEKGPGCVKPPDGQRIQVTWIGSGDGENVRYQHVRGRIRGRDFNGWTLGADLTN